MEVLTAKLICLVLMQLLTLVAGLLPIKLIAYLSSSQTTITRSKADFVISLLNCFAGGVFLGTTFLHLMPEVGENITEIFATAGIQTDFPVAEFITSVGFFLIMLLEHLVMSLQHHQHGAASLWLHDPAHPSSASKTQTGKYGSLSHSGHHHHEHSPKMEDSMEKPITSSSSSTQAPTTRHDCQQALLADIETHEDNCVHIIHPTHHQAHHKDTRQIQGIRSLLLLLALSMHTVFEGLALGLQSSAARVWTLFVAVSIHKLIIAFTMGIQFCTTFENKCRVVGFMVVFSLMSPLGVGIGTAVSSVVEDDFGVAVASAVLQGIATGTFVYVTFFEVLQKEVGQDHSLLKVFVVILGYTVIALINLFSPK